MAPTAAFHEVNDSIRRLAATAGPASETWEFFCECTDAACHVLVRLTLVEFDVRRGASHPQPILASHHGDAAA